MEQFVYIGVGSNLGNRKENLRQAQNLLGCRIEKQSSLYETEPVGYLNQPWFLNAVWQIQTNLSPRELLQRCGEVETQLGRMREIPKGPRTIDLDILFYGNMILNEPDLTIPHPAISERRFVLLPLAEIAPDWIHPVLRKTVRELLRECRDASVVKHAWAQGS